MPWYNDLRPISDDKKIDYALIFPSLNNSDRKRIIKDILDLRIDLDEKIPGKNIDTSLLLASWNIKEFGHLKERIPESYFYIAEVINRFDLVAIQEIKSGLDDLFIIMRLLGSNWSYTITDITEGTDGNKERFAYIFDKRKVKPSGLSGEIVLWDKLTKDSAIKQLKRSPAITGFIAGWKSFSLLNIHLQPGKGDASKEFRKEEVRLLMEAIKEKLKRQHFWNENLIMLGDTNLYKNDDDIVDIINKTDFREAENLIGKVTNVSETEVYDRIFLNVDKTFFHLVKDKEGKEKGNVYKPFEVIYTENKRKAYHNFMLAHKDDSSTLVSDETFEKYYHQYWKRNQISDHNPIWIEIKIDSTDEFLRSKLN
ncbi:endonuclease/exonuclease/phosphatase family protein [Aureibaculum luteum]|uniref:endonuclease/exonuclease/phosphatase family protein n=1 Tax=Aureibaculum luteum TaxID=1548456 RepID=UPI000E51E126|nr:endonuclease/exonuclease/phosphatase family protein [Aureibaculum luteum]